MTSGYILSDMGNLWRVLSRGVTRSDFSGKITQTDVLRTGRRVARGEARRHNSTKLSQ